MTGTDRPAPIGSTAWSLYLDREHAARDMYLRLVERAHREYLTGPFPDRSAYEVVERGAWATYYAAGRDAWRSYRTDIENQAPPAVAPGPLATEAAAQWAAKMGYRPPRPADASHPYPIAPDADGYHGQQPARPAFTPHSAHPDHEGRYVMWADPPQVTDHPESES